jgi:hypothetical protein
MTNEQINIAIFEIFGWKWEPEKNSFHHPENGRLRPKYAPDYCNDLNAMNEAEKRLISEYWMRYCECLTSLLGKSIYASVHATARDRAEAFLKVFGKWEE